MPSPYAVYESLETVCEALRQSAGSLHWEWEGRLTAALTVYTAGDGPGVRAVLDDHFQSRWDPATLAEAPAHIQRFAKSVGGLRGGQELLSTDTSLEPVLVVALWPWGGGAKVSLRMWLLCAQVPQEEQHKLADRFRSLYQ